MQGRTHVRADPERDARLRVCVEEAAREGRPLTWEAAAALCGFACRTGAYTAAKRLRLRKPRVNRAGRIATAGLWR